MWRGTWILIVIMISDRDPKALREYKEINVATPLRNSYLQFSTSGVTKSKNFEKIITWIYITVFNTMRTKSKTFEFPSCTLTTKSYCLSHTQWDCYIYFLNICLFLYNLYAVPEHCIQESDTGMGFSLSLCFEEDV